jgi:hypothetical protein
MIDSRTSHVTAQAWPAPAPSLLSKNPDAYSASIPSPMVFESGVERFYQQLSAILETSEGLDQVLSKTIRLLGENQSCSALFLAERDLQGVFSCVKPLPKAHPELSVSIERVEIDHLLGLTQQSKCLRTQIREKNPFHRLVATPLQTRVSRNAQIELILIGCFDLSKATHIDPVWLIGSTASAISSFVLRRTLFKFEGDQQQILEHLKLQEELTGCQNLDQAARVLVNQIRRLFAASHVSIAFKGKLLAVSDVEEIDLQAEAMQLVQKACHLSAKIRRPVVYTPSADSAQNDAQVLQDFCRELQMESCISLPMPDGSNSAATPPSATLLLAASAAQISDSNYLARLEKLLAQQGQQLNTIYRANRSLRSIAKDRIVALIQHRWRKAVFCSMAAIAIAMAIPVPYRIACNCEIQPVMRRFVVAPFESILDRSLVKHGDLVSKGQIIAHLDGRLLRIELAGMQAELVGAKKKYDSELAANNIALSQIAKSEMDRLKAKIELLEKRSADLEIRSPIDGIIIQGDLEKVQGASLTVGQTLFEIAPLDEMIVEVAIPEREIPYAAVPMEVAIKLNTCPYKTWQGKLDSIHPRSELIENESVFVGQVAISNGEGILRPGMKGKAKIRSQTSCLGWNLFHHAWESLRHWTIW